MTDVRRGLIIVNTGPGKGKTTAAMGTALRAVGNGMKVLMLQFLKGSWHYGELDAVKAFGDNFVMKQLGRGFVKVGGAETDPEDIRMVEEAWQESRNEILSEKCEGCRQIIWKKDLDANLNVCPKCQHHFRVDARTRLATLLDNSEWEETETNLSSTDPLKFVDTKAYKDRLIKAQKETEIC